MPLFSLEVVRGRFDPTATADALAACAECPPPDIVTHNGVTFYSWGRDRAGELKERNSPPAFDHLGRSGRIAVSTDYVYRTVETPAMKALIEAQAGDGQSLADVDEFRLLGRTMFNLGVYAAFFSDQTHKISLVPNEKSTMPALPDYEEALIAEIGQSTLLLPYLVFTFMCISHCKK